jgi:periplasmic copper chaperone A
MIRNVLLAGTVVALLAACGTHEEDVVAPATPAPEAEIGVDAPGEAPPAEVVVQQPWTRAVPPNAPVAAGYLTLINGTQVDDRLLEVRSDAAERVEIHEMLSAGDGTMQMREVEGGLPLPGGISVELRPGGLHLMFFGPDSARWQAGEHIAVTLVFEGVGEREVELEVFAPGDAPSDGGVRMRGPGDGEEDDPEHHGH